MAPSRDSTDTHALVRGFKLHWRLITACAIGVAVGFLLPGEWGLSTRMLSGWAVMVLLYMLFTAWLFARGDLAGLRKRAAEADEGAAFIVLLAALSALASLGAIVVELGIAKANPDTRVWHTALAITTIVLSWAFIHLNFAQHYAHQYYGDRGTHAEGIKFPEKDDPDQWDFLYFSLVIGMTSQVSDVTTSKKTVRRTVLAHSVLAFFYNAAIIALTVNIAASAL